MKKNEWDIKYEIAKQYYEKKGNLLIPSQYITEDNIKIGLWISRQRKKYQNKSLSRDRIELLEKIGMVWSSLDAQWFEYYDRAVKYYNEKGDLLIPLKYSINDCNLGYWIGTQRRKYKQGKLPQDKIQLLEKIGMVWSSYDLKWHEYYELLVDYYNKNGNSLVPLRYRDKENKNLGYWVSHQRINYNSKKLSEEKIKLLEKLDMVWKPAELIWDETYEIAKQYYEEYDNLNVPTVFNYKNIGLGTWIVTQRKNYADNRLTDRQIELLNAIGMEWDSIRNYEYIWEKNYNTVLEFFNKYKHLYMPTNYFSKDGVNIGRWLYEQKLKYKRNELDEYRRRKLELLDKSWLEPSNTKSSFPEQAVLYYVKKYFSSATKLKTKEISEIDIYIPELKVGIEYDGPAHARTVKSDIKKTEACNKQGIKLVRIRDCKCPNITDKSYKIILKNDSFEALDEGIVELLKYLNVFDVDVSVRKDYIEISDNYIKAIDLDWYTMFDKLTDYYKKYGNIDIPISYKTSDGLALGRWLSNMRTSLKKPSLQGIRLNSNKIELLEKLGIDWSPIETQWNKIYDLAKEYYNVNGNLLIPDTYVTFNGIKLGRWIGTQRSNYQEKKITKDKIVLLEKIGMVWDVYEYQWIKTYNEAANYYSENGNLFVPGKYITDNGIRLGNWIGKQRSDYKNNKMSLAKIELLEKIGMIWDVNDFQWMKVYDEAEKYYRKNGNLIVSERYETKEGVRLGIWIGKQRKDYKNNNMSSKKIEMLEKIGMVWFPRKKQWKEYYELALEYYSENGDLLIPERYITKNKVALGVWISNQRRDYKKNILSSDKIDLLEKIGMIWDTNDFQWMKVYNEAKKYYNEQKDLLIPQKYNTNDCDLGRWISKQRSDYKKKKMSLAKIELLEKIGMIWDVNDYQWNEYYDLLVDYYNKHHNVLVPLRYVSEDKKRLGYWISHQRINYKARKLPGDKIELLEKLGMVWEVR